MGLFGALGQVISMPIRATVDVVKMPVKIINGEDGLLKNTVDGLNKIEDELDD